MAQATASLEMPVRTREVAEPRAVLAEDAEQVGADREGYLGGGLVVQGEGQQDAGQQRRERQRGDVGWFGPGRQGRVRSAAEQDLAQDREGVGQAGVELPGDRQQGLA